MKLNEIPVKIDGEVDPLKSTVNFNTDKPLKVCFPILLDGDLVMSSEHLGPAYLVSVLRNVGVDCLIVEIALEENHEDKLEEIKRWQPDIIGISLTTISVALAKKIGSDLRSLLGNDVYFMAGGPLATHHGAKLLSLAGWDFLDGLIRGEGEVPLLRFVEAYYTNKKYGSVPNLVYRDGGELKENVMKRGLLNLDDIPFPARDQFEMHDGDFPYIRISTSRGCTAHCTFCNAPHARNRVGPAIKGWRGVSPKRAVDEVEFLYHKYNFNTFDFVDSTFEDPGGKEKGKNRVKEIATELINRNLNVYYNVCMQAYNWHEEDEELLKLLWKSGLEKVLVGIESGSEEGLARWQKRATVEDNYRVLKLLRAVNVYVAFGFISFHPWISFKEMRENYKFLLKGGMGHNFRRYTVRLELYPGAEVVDQLREAGLLQDSYDSELNPFAYRYTDERMAKLASALNSLYGDDYEASCTIKEEPAIFQFETYDIVLHTFYSRLLRHLGEHDNARNILYTFNEKVEIVKDEISQFNYNFISKYVDLAEMDALDLSKVKNERGVLQERYEAWMKKLKDYQLAAAMQLHRAGYDVLNVNRKVAEALE